MIHVRSPELISSYRKFALDVGFDDLIVFTPEDVNLPQRRIYGYKYDKGEWKRAQLPYPTLGYDLGYYTDSATINKVNKIRSKEHFPFLGSYLGNKIMIQRRLLSSPKLKPHLIPTYPYKDLASLLALLQKYETVMLKPVNGMGGQGIIRLSLEKKEILLKKSDETLQFNSLKQVEEKLKKFTANKKFVVQKWVNISDKKGQVYDIRVLMQKNEKASWTLTGMAVRQGEKDSITSNLKTGGKAYEVYPFLTQQFGQKQADILFNKIKKISLYIPPFLEKRTRRSLFELGLDLCIDQEGHIWILEVNNKPGKTIFNIVSNIEAAEQSVLLPIQYASQVVKQMKAKKKKKK
jgi:glutathione synthase/RimK-type ligase-like ATP-grasp enzyme